MWDYQVELLPNQLKNIWVINGTYTVAPSFKNIISFVDNGPFPPISATNTPTPTLSLTPSSTPTGTPAVTPTPTSTITATQTPTPSVTETPSPTNTQTPTSTQTPTVTPTLSLQSFSVFSGTTSNESCENGTSVTIYASDPLFDQNTQFYTTSTGSVEYDMTGFYSDGTSVTEIDSDGTQVGIFTACGGLVTPTPTATETSTPTPTPTVTQTPTQTFAWYTYSLGTGATSNDACTAFGLSPQTIYGTVAGGVGPNIGEFLYQTEGRPLTDVVPDGFYSNGTAWYQVTGGSGEVTSSDPNGCNNLLTPTPTPTVTTTQTQTPTPSVTATNTPTPTEPVRYNQPGICHDETNEQNACDCLSNANLYTDGVDMASSSFAFSDATGPNTGNPEGYYAQDGIIYLVASGCGPGCGAGSAITLVGPCATSTPTPTPTNTETPTNTPTETATPTPTQSGTPPVTPSPTPSSFGTTTFKVTMLDSARALLNSYTLTESPYVGASGVGFSATTGTYPLVAGPATVYGTHDALSTSTVTFEINSSGSGSVSIFYFVNGSIVSGLNNSAISSGPNTYNLFVAGPVLVTDTIEFQIS
jgi:hypothetical protein